MPKSVAECDVHGKAYLDDIESWENGFLKRIRDTFNEQEAAVQAVLAEMAS